VGQVIDFYGLLFLAQALLSQLCVVCGLRATREAYARLSPVATYQV